MTAREHPRRPSLSSPAPNNAHGTLAELILRQVEAGSNPYAAAGTAGIDGTLLQTWLNEGRVQWTRYQASSADWARDFTPEQQDLALFYEAIQIAVETNRSRSEILLEQHVRGGLAKTTRRRKLVGGQVVEEHETIETLLPSLDALRFKLEHQYPDVYGAKATLRLATVDMSDTPDVGRALEEAMELVARRMAAIDVTSTDGGPADGSS